MNNSIIEMEKEEVLQNLRKADRLYRAAVSDVNKQIKVIIVGGAAFVLREYVPRSTDDIDVLGIRYSELIDIFEATNINYNVNAYNDCFADNYEERIEPVKELHTKNLLFYVLSLEDLVISKLFSGRPKDIKDIYTKEVREQVNYSKLQQIADEEVLQSRFESRLTKEFKERLKEYLKK